MHPNSLKLIFTLSILLFSNLLFATKIKGHIMDDEGNAVPYASIIVKGTNNGTSANEVGDYFIDLPEGKVTLIVRLIGYASKTKEIIVKGESMEINFQLIPEKNAYEDVKIIASNEDPAYKIMRKVIANKSKNANKIKTLETDIYLKGKLYVRKLPEAIMGYKLSENDKKSLRNSFNLDSNNQGIVYLLEQFTKYYFKAPNKSFNNVNAIKTSGNPNGLGFATMPPIVDVYENNVQVLDGLNPRGFISPAHNNAFAYYKYRFENSFMDENNVMINKISFWPKRNQEPTFRGTLYVADGDWVFQQLEMIIDKKAQVENVDTMILRQQYRKTNNGTWVIQQQVLFPVLSIAGVEIAGDFLTNYTNLKVNTPINDSIFKTKLISKYDSNALDANDTFWTNNRPISLSNEEKVDYVFKDSVNAVYNAQADSLYNASRFNKSILGFLFEDAFYQKRNNKIGIEGLIKSVSFNTVEGVKVGLNTFWEHKTAKGNALDIKWNNSYGISNKQFQSLITANYIQRDSSLIGRSRKWSLEAGTQVAQIHNQNPILPLYNSIASLLFGYNYMKLYQSKKVQLGITQTTGTGWNFGVNFKLEDRSHMDNHSNYSFNNKSVERYTANDFEIPNWDNHVAAILNVEVGYQPGWKKIKYPKYTQAISSNLPFISIKYTKGINGILKSTTNFDKYKISLNHELNMKLYGSFKYRIAAGGFLTSKNVPVQDRYHIYGNQIIMANPYLYSFQTANYFSINATPKTYGQAHAEWHLNGFITNKIPGLKQLKWNLILSGNTLYINKADRYTEFGVGLENIGFKMFKILRVDYYMGSKDLQSNWKSGIRIGTIVPLNLGN